MKPFGNNPTFKPCAICKTKELCAEKGKCLLKASDEFSSKFENLLLMFNEKERADRFMTIDRTGKPRKAWVVKNKMDQSLTKAKSPAGYEQRKKLAKLKSIGNLKDSVGVPKLDKKGKQVMQTPGTTPSGERIGQMSSKRKRPMIEKRNMLPKLVAKKTSKVKQDIKKEKAKIATLTTNIPEQAEIRSKKLKKGAKMKIETSPNFAKKQGVVTGTAYDERGNKEKTSNYTKATATGALTGGVVTEASRRASLAKEAKESQNAMKKASKADFDSLAKEQQEKLIKQTMKRKRMNRRGAKSFLRKLKNLAKYL